MHIIEQIYNTCSAYTNKVIDIYILDTNRFKINRISNEFYHKIIRDRRSGCLYKNLYQMGHPSILSFLFSSNYGEIYCSIDNIIRNNNLRYKNIYSDLLIYISHSISNIYEIDNYMYNIIISCVQRHNF